MPRKWIPYFEQELLDLFHEENNCAQDLFLYQLPVSTVEIIYYRNRIYEHIERQIVI